MSDFYGLGLHQLADEREYDPRSGITTIQRWQGTLEQIAAVESAALAIRQRYAISEDDTGGYWTIRLWNATPEDDNADTPLSDVWELDSNDSEISLWAMASFRTQIGGITLAGTYRIFRRDVEDYLAGKTKTRDGEDLTLDFILNNAATLGVDSEFLKSWIFSLELGDDSAVVSQDVLTRTVSYAPASTVKASRTNINRSFTTAELSSGTDPSAGTIPDTIKFQLADGFWIKKGPRVRQIASTRYEIIQEWWHADYVNAIIYPPHD